MCIAGPLQSNELLAVLKTPAGARASPKLNKPYVA